VKKIYLLFLLFSSSLLSQAQWNSNTSENLKAADLTSSDILTAGTSDGSTYVLYYTPFEGDYFLRVQLLSNGGIKLLGDSGVVINRRKSGSATYVISACTDAEDNLIIGFQYQRGGELLALLSKVTTKGKLPWGEFGIDLGPGLSPSVAALSNGDVAVAWNNDNIINYQKVTSAGILWPAAKEITASPNGVTRPQVVPLTDSSFGIVYQQKTGLFSSNLYEQRFDNDGNAVWGAPVQLSDYITSTFHSYSVLSNDDITYIGYYANPDGQNRFDGFVQKVNGDGALPWGLNGSSFAAYSTVTDPYIFEVNIAYNQSDNYIWAVSTLSDFNQFEYGIAVQKFDMATGQKLLGDNGKTVFDISANSERQVGNLSLCSDGPLFLFYDITNKLYATGLNADGNFAWPGDKTEIGSTINAKSRYGFTPVNLEQAVAVWQEDRGDGDFPYAQNINCDGITGIVLPVSLTNFTGTLSNSIVTLLWQTNNENNNKGFHIQRSADGRNFSTIDFTGTKAIVGYSNTRLAYAATDAKVLTGNNYYRLLQEDNDGKFTYSNVILIKNAGAFVMRMNNVYPNPAGSILNLYIESATTEKANFIVSDATGKTVKQLSVDIVNGNNNIQLNIAGLAAGNYFIKLSSKSFYQNAVQHFIKY